MELGLDFNMDDSFWYNNDNYMFRKFLDDRDEEDLDTYFEENDGTEEEFLKLLAECTPVNPEIIEQIEDLTRGVVYTDEDEGFFEC